MPLHSPLMRQMESRCTVCQSENLQHSLSFGKQPASNRYRIPLEDRSPVNGYEDCHLLSLGYCMRCGTIQLADRMPIETVRPRFDWLAYNEPEAHLDDLASELKNLIGINMSSRFLGVTYKDKNILDRIKRLGFTNTSCINENSLNAQARPFGIETIQETLSKHSTIERIGKVYGQADVLIVSHIIEHAADANSFIHSLRGLLVPNGYVLLELPDSERILSAGNHAFIWEEHISYFTEKSIRIFVKTIGAELIWFKRYSYAFEDSLTVLIRFSDAKVVPIEVSKEVSEDSAALLVNFSKKLIIARESWYRKLELFSTKGIKVAVFGAGHLATKFINFYGLADLIDCVIDDHPKKIGMLMPGSGLPIVSSKEIASRRIKVCISTLNPESEAKVLNKLTNFLNDEGQFIPAFKKNLEVSNIVLSLSKVNNEVFIALDEIVRLDSKACDFIKECANQNFRGRARICMHKNLIDNLHEMLIGIRDDSYIRPHKHKKKTESFHLVEGSADIVILTDDGEIFEVIEISPRKNFYYRIDTPRYHTLLINSPVLVIHEVTNGPFDPFQGDEASFSPAEGSSKTLEYIKQLRLRAKKWKKEHKK